MSSWTSLRFDGYDIWSSHSYASHEEVSLFQDGDKHLRLRVILPEGDALSPWLDVAEVDALPWRRAEERFLLPPTSVISWERPAREDESSDGGAELRESGTDPIGTATQLDTRSNLVVEAELDLEHRFAGQAYITTVARAKDRLEAMGFTLGAANRVFDEFVEQERALAAEFETAHPSMREIYRLQFAVVSSTTSRPGFKAGGLVARSLSAATPAVLRLNNSPARSLERDRWRFDRSLFRTTAQ